jgi:hypothetical protein
MSTKLTGFLQMTAVAVGSAGLFWLLREHWQHALPFLGYAPFLLFLACPLMHLFMHHGGGHGHADHISEHRHEPGSQPGA